MDPYIGEIRLFAGNFAPYGWALCDGSSLAIATYSALFNLIGTTYGGDGQQYFNLPDLRSRVPRHQGDGTFVMGQRGGDETVTLTQATMPTHTHTLQAGGSSAAAPGNAQPGTTNSTQTGTMLYGTGSAKPTTLAPASVQPSVGGQPHPNIQPFLAVTFIIALFGIYPSPS